MSALMPPLDHPPALPGDALADAAEDRAEWLAHRRVALHTIRSLVEFWRIQPQELEGGAPLAREPQPVVIRPPKYRHPVTSETWDGEGRQPDWLRAALLREGYTVAELRQAVEAALPLAEAAPAALPLGH